MNTLIIVESPTKAKTISTFLGKNYIVESSFGHVRDLPKSRLGIDVNHGFTPSYLIPAKAKTVVRRLKDIAQKSDTVILATDEDREGEAIAWHLSEALGLTKSKSKGKGQKAKLPAVERIVFHEITKRAIDEALAHPRAIDEHLVDAQQTRRMLDRIVGYTLSPFLWQKVARGLSAGRVQSVTVRLIVERENEIRAFKSQEYWTIIALLETVDFHRTSAVHNIETQLVAINEKPLDKFAIPTREQAETIARDLEKQKYAITAIAKKELRRNPLPPFTTSTLQQEAAKRLHYTAKKTMFLAQQLYEQGAITYMRTDSVNLSRESTEAAKQFLEKEWGAAYAADAPRFFQTKSKSAQEAHEAIRPTDPMVADANSNKLYALIWQRFMASQMPQAIFNNTTIDITAGKYTLRAAGTTLQFDGYLKAWPQKFEERELPLLKKNDALILKEVRPEQHFTEPPARYSEASLVKMLEEYGIGRPSTYAPIISVIQTREYVTKEKGRFVPTKTGELVNAVLTEHFPETTDINFTATMENTLDAIAEGKEQWQDVLGSFYAPFIKNLEVKYAAVQPQKIEKLAPEKTDEVCEKCGKPMVIRTGRYGKFMACSGFPECKNTKRIEVPATPNGMKCPTCAEGDVILRRTKKGRIFWGCSRYPQCDYASWKNPAPLKEVKSTEQTPTKDM